MPVFAPFGVGVVTPRSSAPALVLLLLALAAACLLAGDPDRWTPYTNSGITLNHMAVVENLSPEHRFLGFYTQRLDDEGRLYYLPYNRFPVLGHLLIKLVTLPFPDDMWARLRAARLLMLALHAAAATLAWLALRRLVRNPWTALAATLLAFSSYHALYYADMVATEGVVDLFGLLLVFHGMAVFATEGRYGQLVAKTCGALLLGWHVYALVGPFVTLGLASAWRRGDGRAARRYLTLGVVAVLFGSVVLGTNVAREHAALGGETPVAELPSVRSALERTSVIPLRREFNWPRFVKQQFSRIGLASVPYAVGRFVVDDIEPPVADRYGTPAIVAVSALLVLATLVLVVRPATRHRLPLAALALSGPCWAVILRNNVSVYVHEHEGMFYVGVPLVLFALVLPRLDRLLRRVGVRRRVTVVTGAAATATFVLSGLFMARTVHDPERVELERTVMTDFDVIRRMAEGKTIAVLPGGAHPYYSGDIVRTDFDGRHFADFVLSDWTGGGGSLTLDNRLWFLYERSVYEAALSRYGRRADVQRPVLQSPDYDVHFFRNERGGGELLYFRRECSAAWMTLRRQPGFFLHVHPVDTNDLPAYRRRHGFEIRDFRFAQFWRRDGKCYAVRPLPDYNTASIRTGQFTTVRRTREDARYEHVWAGSFSPDGHDGAVGGAPPR